METELEQIKVLRWESKLGVGIETSRGMGSILRFGLRWCCIFWFLFFTTLVTKGVKSDMLDVAAAC